MMITSALPAMFFARMPTLNGPAAAWQLYLSALLGYAGLVMLLWMYVIGNKSIFGVFFRDLAPVLKLHAWLGKYGTLLIFLHPLLVTLSYGQTWLYSLIPGIGSSFERHVTLGRIALFVLIVVWITSAVIRDRIRYRPWKYIHFFGYIALPFALLHAPLIGTQIRSNLALKAYYFGLVAVFIAFSLLKLYNLLNLDKRKYRLTGNQPIGDDAYYATFIPEAESIPPPRPGQYIYVKLGLISEDHPFSVVDHNPRTGTITIAYRTYGKFTRLLSRLPPGTDIYLSGAYGSFTQQPERQDSPPVLIAGGIGITPFMSRIINNQSERPWLIYANRSISSSLFLPALRRRLGDRLIEIYSRQVGRPAEYIDLQAIRSLAIDPRQHHFYICGPAAMITQTKTVLGSLGVTAGHIHAEEFKF